MKTAVKEPSQDRHIEDAYKKGEYEKLHNLLENINPDSATALFYKGVAAENGLGQEVNKEGAIVFYKSAFAKGKQEAGNYLARIYQKSGDPLKAKEASMLYKKIAAQKDNPMAAAYAQYRLTRIEEKQILNNKILSTKEIHDISSHTNSKLLKVELATHKIEKIKAAISEYDHVITIEETHAPNSTAHAKALYHKALLLLKLSELDEEKLILAQEALDKSAKMSYAPAKAELLNLETRKLTDPETIIIGCDEALEIDPKNINAKLLKVKAIQIELNGKFDEEKHNQSLQLIREILKKDPSHLEALEQRKKLLAPLIERIAKGIIEELGNQTLNVIKEYNSFSGLSQAAIDRLQKERLSYLNSLKDDIKKSLESQKYFQDNIVYNEIDNSKVSGEIGARIRIANDANLKNIINNIDRSRETNVKLSIKGWSDKQVRDHSLAIDKESQDLLDNRREFREHIVSNLMDYHDRCSALDNEKFGLTVKTQDSWFATIGHSVEKLAPLAGFLGPQASLIGNLTGLAAGAAANADTQARVAALMLAAKHFAYIGKNEQGVKDSKYKENARKRFEYIADVIVKKYGMQIDNTRNIEALANAATEKMLNHLNNSTTIYKGLKEFAKSFTADISSAFLKTVTSLLTNEKENESDFVILLIEGITEGESKDKNFSIANRPRRTWKADEVFNKPLLTTNGTEFFSTTQPKADEDLNETSKYGAAYVEEVNGKHPIKIPLDAQAEITQNFKRHQELLELDPHYTPEQKEQHQEIEEPLTHKKLSDARGAVRISFISAALKGLAGVAGLYASAVVGMATALGLPVVSFIPFAAAIGLTSVMIPPIAIAVAAVSLVLIVKGIRDAVKASDDLAKLDKTVIKPTKVEHVKTKDEIAKEQQHERARTHVDKLKKNAKFTTADSPGDKAKDSIMRVMTLKKLANRWKAKAGIEEKRQAKKEEEQNKSFFSRFRRTPSKASAPGSGRR